MQLYKIPTIEQNYGTESFAYLNPNAVTAVVPNEITVYKGEETLTVKVTFITTTRTTYFSPLSVEEVARKLGILLAEAPNA